MDNISSTETTNYVERVQRKDSSIILELKTLLTNYLANNPNITANSFCLKNNLSSSTVNNLLTGVTKKYVSPEVARKIVCGIHRGKTIGFVLRNTKGHLGEVLRQKYSSLIDLEIEENQPEVDQALVNKNARLVMLLAHNKGGTTREEILETLDAFALKSVDKLISENILYEDQMGVIRGKKERIYVNNEIAKEIIQEINYFSKPSEDEDSQIKLLWGRLSKEKRQKQKAILIETIKKLRKLYEEEDLEGEPTFVTITADLLKQPNLKGERT